MVTSFLIYIWAMKGFNNSILVLEIAPCLEWVHYWYTKYFTNSRLISTLAPLWKNWYLYFIIILVGFLNWFLCMLILQVFRFHYHGVINCTPLIKMSNFRLSYCSFYYFSFLHSLNKFHLFKLIFLVLFHFVMSTFYYLALKYRCAFYFNLCFTSYLI